MPVHDWTRVDDGTFHALHTLWLGRLSETMNELLPSEYYVLPELKVQVYIPDITTLTERPPSPADAGRAGTAVAAEPQADRRVALRVGARVPARRLVVRASRGRRVVAIVELVSPGNKHRPAAVDDFADKVADFVSQGLHAVVVDILPPGSHDPGGPHPEVCARLDPDGSPGDPPPADRPLTFAGYRAGADAMAFLRYAAVGQLVPKVPLFLDNGDYVDLPLEATYTATYARLPAPVRAVLEGDIAP